MKSNFINSIFINQKQRFINESIDHEDKEVINFLNNFKNKEKLKYLEVGSGLGRFPIKIRSMFANINIECLEINPDLAKITFEKGLHTTISDATVLPYPDESFDILHCSHIIEHLKYPEVSVFLDQLMRVTKTSGYIIIRSPLLHPDFYLDIDHVRPYPPDTIINYFNNQQQQKVGKGSIKVIRCWYRRENYKFFNIGTSKTKYFINAFFALLWVYFKFPFSKKNGYVLILQKI